MDKRETFQERFLLTLDSEATSALIRSVLESPLGLSHKVINCLFENRFDEIRGDLDNIKEFVAGVSRAERLGKDYALASYYPSLFAFHQYFHSSYRARQGKTLEEFIKEVLRATDPSLVVPDDVATKIRIMATAFRGYGTKGDMDVIVQNQSKIMVIQLRSRDDTGGTTAKSSLVEVFRTILALPKIRGIEVVYHIGIWEKIKSNQKSTTKNKFWETLTHQLTPLGITKERFLAEVEDGIVIKPEITLKLSYGNEEILKVIKEWLGNPQNLKDSAIKDMIIKLESWDDLWLSYAIASMEMEVQKIGRFNNIKYLDLLLAKIKYDTGGFTKNEEYVSLANELASKISPLWKQPSIPLPSTSDRVHYIRDLILLRLIYEHL